METIYEFTEPQLIKVFKKWNKEFMSYPEKYEDIKDGSEIQQAKMLIEYLNELK